MNPIDKLIFVYNAKSGFFNKVADFTHKAFSPATYGCQLCSLTYEIFDKKPEWKDFIKSLTIETVFLYKNDFEKNYDLEEDLPVILGQNGTEKPLVLLSATELNELKSVSELIVTLKKQLNM